MAPKDVEAIEPEAISSGRLASIPLHRWRRLAGIAALALLGPLAALALGIYVYLAGGRYVVTDNAYVKSAKIAVSPDISGRVTHVAVEENQQVQPGALLFRVERAPYKIALERAKAQVLAAQQAVEALRAAHRQKQASLVRSQGEVEHHTRMLKRQQRLARKKLVSGLNLDTAKRNLRDAKDRVKVTEQELAQAAAKLGGDPKIKTGAHPRVLEAVALQEQAALELQRTEIRASMAGVVTNFDLQEGEYVTAGRPVFSLVGIDRTWVHANYKETELTHVRVGQRATISVDTFPNRTFLATVAGISPATGAEFALLPPQNSTGNWVKVVQRLTVRLDLDESAPDSRDAGVRLRAGMSAHVEIDTEYQRKLSGLFATIAGFGG